jgi:hypothetical protein
MTKEKLIDLIDSAPTEDIPDITIAAIFAAMDSGVINVVIERIRENPKTWLADELY